MANTGIDWEDTLRKILVTDTRYAGQAYIFVDRALRYTAKKIPKDKNGKPIKHHVTGSELSQGFIALLFQECNTLAPSVLKYWGVLTGRDIGNIVYTLIDWNILSKSADDRLEDFDEIGELIPMLEGLASVLHKETQEEIPKDIFPRIDI